MASCACLMAGAGSPFSNSSLVLNTGKSSCATSMRLASWSASWAPLAYSSASAWQKCREALSGWPWMIRIRLGTGLPRQRNGSCGWTTPHDPPFTHAPCSPSAAADFAFRFNHEELSLHVFMNIAPEGHLRRFADTRHRIRLRLLCEMQRHRLPRLKMIRPVPLALFATDFHPVSFLFRDALFEHGRSNTMGHRAFILDDDPGQ